MILSYIIHVICVLCIVSVSNAVTYRAAVRNVDIINGGIGYVSREFESLTRNADIVLLSCPELSDSENFYESVCGPYNYDKIIRDISETAKKSGVYVVTQLYENIGCENRAEVFRSSLVFDRHGDVAVVYRKPVNHFSVCNVTSTKAPTFTTDFGVTFALFMDEDVILQDFKEYEGVNNFIITGGSSEIKFVKASGLTSSWAYVTGANVISTSGLYAGKAGLKAEAGKVFTLDTKGEGKISHISLNAVDFHNFPGEDLSQYITRPLDMEASLQGYEETVCHGHFCCEFYVKSRLSGLESEDAHYGLAAYEGVRQLGAYNYAVQSCQLLVCAGLYKRSCFLGSENNTNVVFDKIKVRGEFAGRNSAQFPIILTTETSLSPERFAFDAISVKDDRKVTAELSNTRNVLKFGIFSRDYTKDFEEINPQFNSTQTSFDNVNNLYDYIFNEDVIEFFDYLWIRIRVLIFLVSIYILEMM